MNNVENYIVYFNTFTNHVLMKSIHPSWTILKVKLGMYNAKYHCHPYILSTTVLSGNVMYVIQVVIAWLFILYA